MTAAVEGVRDALAALTPEARRVLTGYLWRWAEQPHVSSPVWRALAALAVEVSDDADAEIDELERLLDDEGGMGGLVDEGKP